MKKYIVVLLIAITIATFLGSCRNNTKETPKIASTNLPDSIIGKYLMRDKVLTAEEQKSLTPDMVIQRLKEGNQRFLNNDLTIRNHTALVRDGVQGQFPMAVVLSCMDSRVPVEDVFDCAIGDIFVCRVAGNVVNEDILASLEYGCKVSGSKLIVVMGHRYCGAVQSAIKDVELGNITQLLAKIKPAIEQSDNFVGEKNYTNEKYVTHVAICHVKNVAEEIMGKSQVLKEMADKGEIKIIASGYDLHNGEIVFFE